MPMSQNPFESPRPGPELPPVAQAEYMQVARRPKTPLVVGIISLVFGLFGLLGNVSGLVMYLLMPQMAALQQGLIEKTGQSMTFVISMWIIGTVVAAWLLATGIGLVRYRNWSRMGFNLYAVAAILMSIVGAYMAATQTYPAPPGEMNAMAGEIDMVQRVLGVVFNLAGMLFPVLGVTFLNRPFVAASLK